jgi:putative Mg2+ transporter-C (MgtC) family protein
VADLASPESLAQAEYLGVAFVLCSLIGVERLMAQKSAGYRTHVLVGLGSCGFTLVSAYGFAGVLGSDVGPDPSRIAAQVVSGIGFLGAGVIFKGHDAVRGLTTAATIWMAAAVGMACGAGMVLVACMLTALHLVTLLAAAPLVRHVPTADSRRVLRVVYVDGRGVLRRVLGVASEMGFSSSILSSRRTSSGERGIVTMDIRFVGKVPLRDLVAPLAALEDVEHVAARGVDASDDDDDAGLEDARS